MPKQVTKWEADNGLFFDTEEQAIEADNKSKAKEKFIELTKAKIGSVLVVDSTFEALWKIRKEFLPFYKAGLE